MNFWINGEETAFGISLILLLIQPDIWIFHFSFFTFHLNNHAQVKGY